MRILPFSTKTRFSPPDRPFNSGGTHTISPNRGVCCASPQKQPPTPEMGSCENSDNGRARRSISKKSRIMESNHTARMRLDALLENCFFYISPIYEFLHSQGHFQTSRRTPSMVRFTPESCRDRRPTATAEKGRTQPR